MCMQFAEPPPAVPLAVHRSDDGATYLDLTALVGKAVQKSNGVHRTTLPYEIGRWTWDQEFKVGSHDSNLHLAPGLPQVLDSLNSFGSHRMLMLPSRWLYSKKHETARCLHDRGVFGLGCLDCGDMDYEDLNVPDFWQEALRLPRGAVWIPNPELDPATVGQDVFVRKALISAN